MDKAAWFEEALEYATQYLYKLEVGDSFMVCDMRTWAHRVGCPLPPSLRNWGSVINALMHDGVVRRVGYRSTPYEDEFSSSLSNPTPRSVWVKLKHVEPTLAEAA